MNQKCDRCGAPMIPLLTSWVCKAECDLAPKVIEPSVNSLLWKSLPLEPLHDFGDGRGLVAAHQHPNGLGWVADTATVALTAYVGPNAKVFGGARVIDYAQILDTAQVFGHAVVGDRVRVAADARVSGTVQLRGSKCFTTGHLVSTISDFLRRVEQQEQHMKELGLTA